MGTEFPSFHLAKVKENREAQNLQNFYAILCNLCISSAMAMAMSMYRTLCVLLIYLCKPKININFLIRLALEFYSKKEDFRKQKLDFRTHISETRSQESDFRKQILEIMVTTSLLDFRV